MQKVPNSTNIFQFLTTYSHKELKTFCRFYI